MLIDVNTEDGTFLAKVVDEGADTYKVQYLVAKNKELFDYESIVHEIEKECVCGMYDPDDTEEQAGFVRVEGGFIQLDEDEDYEPSESDEEDDDESLCDEEEEED
jgi:hypothetical protein